MPKLVRTAIYSNAVDSLRIGMEFFLRESSYSTRKHAILTLFHAIELFLKEHLYRINPILIYRNIDARITDDSLTVGTKEIVARLDNLGLGLPKDAHAVIEKMQKRRNRIEHHYYDHRDEDETIIAESLQFILFFVDEVLKKKLDGDIPAKTLREIQRVVFEHSQLYNLARHRLENWMREQWPKWNEKTSDSPHEFPGTLDCPVCRQEFLVIGYHKKPFCFHCNTTVDAEQCENCGTTHLRRQGCSWCRQLA